MFKHSRVAKVKCKKERGATSRSKQWRWFRRTGPSLTPRCSELVSVLSHDRGGRFELNADGAALIDKGALGGNAPNDILGGQYRRHPATTFETPHL